MMDGSFWTEACVTGLPGHVIRWTGGAAQPLATHFLRHLVGGGGEI